jgi:hypothetical protein
MLSAITVLNAQIRDLAPVLNAETRPKAVTVTTAPADVPVALRVQHHAGIHYLFTVNLRPRPVRATFVLREITGVETADLLHEPRQVKVQDAAFADDFEPYQVHLYRLSSLKKPVSHP